MPRDESLTATTTNADPTATQLFELLTVEDVAALLKVSKSWVYEHVRVAHRDRIAFPTSRSGSTCASIPGSCARFWTAVPDAVPGARDITFRDGYNGA